MESFERALPAEVGVPPGSILRTLQSVEAAGLELHSFLLLRHGRLAAEVYAAPLDAETPHRLYSVTKSLVALAVGCLVEEGKLELSGRVVEYFPEYTPPNPHPWLAACTLRDLLTMQSCHTATTYKANPKSDWVAGFFITPPAKPPGVLFHYDTSATHVATALVEKCSGQSLLAYLRKKCLDAIGWGQAKILPDPFGVSMGGSGLVATPLDAMRLAALLLNGGAWAGRQLLPPGFLREATACQVPTAGWAALGEEARGYGYYFWRIRGEGYMAYGKGGQYILCWPGQDLAIVTTADTQGAPGGSARLLGCVIDGILPALDGRAMGGEQAALEEYCRGFSLRTLQGTGSPAKDLACTYRLGAGASFHRLEWAFEKDTASLTLWDGEGPWHFRFGLNRAQPGQFPRGGGLCAASAAWLGERELALRVSMLGEESASIQLRAAFPPGGCMLEMKNTCEMCYERFAGAWYARREEEG